MTAAEAHCDVDMPRLTVYAAMADHWLSIVGSPPDTISVADWERQFAQAATAQRRLVASGHWVSGYEDLMHVARVADGELAHSNVLAWLLNPAGKHGLGDRLLVALMAEGWPGSVQPEAGAARVEREVRRGTRIADVVVTMDRVVLVIENKVWSDESTCQCEDLYQIWTNSEHGTDIRFLLLTLDGHAPRSTTSVAAANAWRSLAYPALGGWLQTNLPVPPRSIAERTIEQYAATIAETSRGTRAFAVTVGGGHLVG